MRYPEEMNFLWLSKYLVSKHYRIEKIKFEISGHLSSTINEIGLNIPHLRIDISNDLRVSESSVGIDYGHGYLCILLHFMDKYCKDKKAFWSFFDAVNKRSWRLGILSRTKRGQIDFHKEMEKVGVLVLSEKEKENGEVLFNKKDVPEWLGRMNKMKIRLQSKKNIKALRKHDWAAVCDRLLKRYQDGR